MSPATPRIVMVDEAPPRLAGLGRALVERGADVQPAGTAAAALALVRGPGTAAIVAADALADGDGVALLDRARGAAPGVVRVFVPRGGAPEHVLRAVGAANHVMARPDDADELLGAVERARVVNAALDNARLRRLPRLPGGLPPLPSLYVDLVAALQGPDGTLEKAGEVIARDDTTGGQLLEIVNSAWFGLMERVTSVAMAINYLGVTNVASLVLSGVLFREAGPATLARLGLSGVWDRSLLAGTFARAIARAEELTSRETDDAFTASLLHDAGQVLLAARATDDYAEVLRRAREQGLALEDAEAKLLGFTSPDAGAFLLASWGLPGSVVEAVAFRRRPAELPHGDVLPLTIAHVATALGTAGAPHNWSRRKVAVDEAYIAAVGGTERLERWQEACRAAVRLDGVGA